MQQNIDAYYVSITVVWVKLSLPMYVPKASNRLKTALPRLGTHFWNNFDEPRIVGKRQMIYFQIKAIVFKSLSCPSHNQIKFNELCT